MPDEETSEELFAAFDLDTTGAGSFWPGTRKCGRDLTEAFVISCAGERDSAQSGAEEVCLAEADALAIEVAAEIAGLGGFVNTRVAEGDDIADMVGDPGNQIAGPDIVIAAYIGAEKAGRDQISLEGNLVRGNRRPGATGEGKAGTEQARHRGYAVINARRGIKIGSAQE